MFQTLFFLLFLSFISHSDLVSISLSGNDWTITNTNNTYTVQGATVPGSIHTILLSANKISDPYLGFNDINQRYLVETNWIFTKKFNLSTDFLTFNDISIHLEQIDTIANITINGYLIGKTNNMFLRYIFEISNTYLKVENEIQIDFQSPVTYALEQAIAYNDTYHEFVPPSCPEDVQKGICHVQFIRKEPCSFSWNWGPAFAPIGIPRDLYLVGANTTEINILLETVNVVGFNKDAKTWQVDVMLSSKNDPFTSKLKFILENTTWTYETSPPFNHSLIVTLSIPEDKVLRWWPNEYGNQPLYSLIVFNNDQTIDTRLLGFRTVELIQEKYDGGINGLSFYFSINSQPIYVKGSNWIPSDSFQERVTDKKFEQLLLSAKVAHMNMLRVWGGGIYERREFYELADRLGIMLWHDFMFACSLYPVDQPFLSNVHDEIIYQVKRLQHHPSIVLWSGNNENEAAIAENWYKVPDDKKNQTKDDYRKLYIDTVMNAVKQIDTGSNRPFVTSSPSNGLETINENYIANNPQDPLYGDVHFYDYSVDSWNSTTYPITRFLSETGIQSLPSLDTWYQITSNQSDLYFNSSLLDHREHAENELAAMLNYIQSNLLLPITTDQLKRFTQIIYLSQIHQAMTLKMISDVCRIHSSKEMIDPKTSQGHTMGLMYWQINDIWQAPTWATIEYGLKWKMSHYYVKHMYSPVYAVVRLTPYLANRTDETAQVTLYVVNDISTGVRGELVCGVYTLDTFTPQVNFGVDVSFNSIGVQRVLNIPYVSLMKSTSCNDTVQCIIYCSLSTTEQQGRQTLFLNRPKTYQLLNPNLKIQNITSTSPSDFDITITADRPALFVWLDIPTNITGYFSKNGFHMFEPTVIISFHSWTPITTLNLRQTISLYDVTQP